MPPLIFFGRLLVWFSVRHMRRYKGRTAAVLLGIALGAAVFTSVRLSIHASLDAFSSSVDLLAGRADLVVASPGGRVAEALVPLMLADPAVAAASAVMSAYVKPFGGSAEPFLLLAFDPLLDRPLRNWQARPSDRAGPWRDLLQTPGTLVLTPALARQLAAATGSRLLLAYVERRRSFRIAGRLAPRGLARAEGGRIGITDIATFQEFSGIYGRVDRIDLLLRAGAGERDLQRLRRLLPRGTLLRAPTETKESGRRMIRAYQLNLSILSFVSLFVGMFLVYSLVALNAAARRRELAILRAVGSSPAVLFGLFLGEGALFGIFGWLLALPISTLLVKYLLHGISRTISTLFVRVQVDRLSLNSWELLLSFGLTLLVSVLAALQPARSAMRVAPKEALVVTPVDVRYHHTVRYLAWAGLAAAAMAWPLSGVSGPPGLPLSGYLAVFVLVVGFALLSPWCLQELSAALAPLLNRLFGPPALLACRYMRDSGARTAISVGALITAVALFASLVIMIHSFRQTVAVWVEQTISGDLFIRPKMAEFNRYRDPFPARTIASLGRLRAPVEISPSRRIYLNYRGEPYHFEAMDLKIFLRYGSFVWLRGDAVRLRGALQRGEGAVVSEVFANRTGLGIGDRFQTVIAGVPLDLPILGIVRDYRTHGGVVFYDLTAFNRHFEAPLWNGARFYFRQRPADMDGALADLRREILDACGDTMELVSGRGLRREILDIFDETFAVTTVLLLIALVVAALGITTTLTVLVLERARQLSTLLAVGGSLGQIRAMIFWEAALMIVVGQSAGLVCGFCLSYLLVHVINKASFGWTFLYAVDWWTLASSLPMIFTAALLATLPAARGVLRRPPAALLREQAGG